jgi:soluble lytic murein transglycosylase-like protein
MYRDTRGGLHFSNAPTEARYRFYRSEAELWRPVRWTSWGRKWADPKRYKAYDHIITDAARRHQVDVALVKAVIKAESDFVPDAVSPAGALGLMQLMPGTARLRGVGAVFEPQQNINGGVKHLRYLLDRYNGNLRLALAAYNAGEKAVDRSGGVPPYRETWEYLTRVMRFRDRYLQEPLAQRN